MNSQHRPQVNVEPSSTPSVVVARLLKAEPSPTHSTAVAPQDMVQTQSAQQSAAAAPTASHTPTPVVPPSAAPIVDTAVDSPVDMTKKQVKEIQRVCDLQHRPVVS